MIKFKTKTNDEIIAITQELNTFISLPFNGDIGKGTLKIPGECDELFDKIVERIDSFGTVTLRKMLINSIMNMYRQNIAAVLYLISRDDYTYDDLVKFVETTESLINS